MAFEIREDRSPQGRKPLQKERAEYFRLMELAHAQDWMDSHDVMLGRAVTAFDWELATGIGDPAAAMPGLR
jgi:hypothetical protein